MTSKAKAKAAESEDTSDDVTIKAHFGVDDATQRDVPVGDHPVMGALRNLNRGAVDQDADIDVRDLAGQQYPVEEDVMRPRLEDRDTLVWQKEYLVLPGPESYGHTDPTNDVFTGALQQGYRPVGDVRLASVTDHPDGLHKIVKWEVDVKPTKSEDEIFEVAHQVGRRRKTERREQDLANRSDDRSESQRKADEQAEHNHPKKDEK